MLYDFLGASETAALRLVVMDVWNPFRKATRAHAPQVAILHDKFQDCDNSAARSIKSGNPNTNA